MTGRCLILTAVVAVTLALPVSALAQGMGQGQGMGMGPGQGQGQGMGMGPGQGMGPGMWPGLLPDPAGLPALKQRLQITPEQEGKWKAYADGVVNANEMRQKMHETMRGQAPAQRWEGRADRRAAGAQVHDGVNQLRDDLAKALSPEQRRTLDSLAPPVPPPPGW